MLRTTRLDDPAEKTEGARALVMTGIALVLATTLALGLVVTPARAEHEPQYRYTVLGYVKDAAGKPRKAVGLEVVRQKTGFAYVGETDAAGLYVIVTRLADESRSERLLVRAGPVSLMIAVRFEPADHAAERGTQVDFTGGRATERADQFAGTLKRFLSK